MAILSGILNLKLRVLVPFIDWRDFARFQFVIASVGAKTTSQQTVSDSSLEISPDNKDL